MKSINIVAIVLFIIFMIVSLVTYNIYINDNPSCKNKHLKSNVAHCLDSHQESFNSTQRFSKGRSVRYNSGILLMCTKWVNICGENVTGRIAL